MKIGDILAREILDSRGNPTIEVDVILSNGVKATVSVPSGASTGSREDLELRDNDSRYHGKGVIKGIRNITTIIKPALMGMTLDQVKIDNTLIRLDGTENKSKLGANAILAVSLACLKAGAKSVNKELYEYVSSGKVTLPIPMMNIINGKSHADNNIDIQEFMIVPVVKTFKEKLRAGSEVFHELKKILKENKLNTNVGDEGGFAPSLENNEAALKLIMQAIESAGYVPGKDIFIAMDVAASELYNKETDTYTMEGKTLTSALLMEYYINLLQNYPIVSIEDPFDESDFDSLAKLTEIIGANIMLVGDDTFVTHKKLLEKAISMNAGNAILLKANQVGTVTEMVDTIMTARKANYKMVISHRSGETEDTFIADLAVGLNIPYIKTGSLSRGERIAKYNRLLRIEEKLTK